MLAAKIFDRCTNSKLNLYTNDIFRQNLIFYRRMIKLSLITWNI